VGATTKWRRLAAALLGGGLLLSVASGAAEQAKSAGPGLVIEPATVLAIRANRSRETRFFQIASKEPIIVVAAADLKTQAAMFNRVAMLFEDKNAPHNRILSHAETDVLIKSEGGTFDGFYKGHDYHAAQIAGFLGIASRDRVALNPQERHLADLATYYGWHDADASGAIISIPPVGGEIDATERDAIMRHELSHAAFFTDRRYRDLSRVFIATAMTEAERQAVWTFLEDEGYDRRDKELMINEGQAYLFNTPTGRFFSASSVHMTDSRLTALRVEFFAEVPAGWFRDYVLEAGGP
jgi:hypothetical protein